MPWAKPEPGDPKGGHIEESGLLGKKERAG
jgi:hypothetical protein